MRQARQFRTAFCFAITCCLATTVVHARQTTDPAEVRQVRKLVESEQEVILFFAHPTATFQSLKYRGHKALRDGFTVTYRFDWQGADGSDGYSELAFVLDSNGKFDFIRVEDTSALFFKPFVASNMVVGALKREVQKDPNLQNDRALMKLLDKDAKAILETYLRRDIDALMTLLRGMGLSGGRREMPAARPAADSELIELIRKSESMSDAERKDWMDRLPLMTPDQVAKLKEILLSEKRQLAEIDRKYAGTDAARASLDQARALIDRGESARAIPLLSSLIADNASHADAYLFRAFAHVKKGDPKLAIADYSKVIELQPKSDQTYRLRANAYGQLGDYRRQFSDYTRSLELAPDSPQALNAIAWLSATCPDAHFRNGSEAVVYATKACEKTAWKDAIYLDTLAAAYAEVGQFDKAVLWQQKAVGDPEFAKRVGNDEFLAARRRLELFQQGKPYRGQ